MQHHAADELDVEMTLLQGSLGGLADDRERLELQLVQRYPLRQTVAELVRLRPQCVVGQTGQGRFQRIDRVDRLAHGLDQAIVRRAEQPPCNGAEHGLEILLRGAAKRERAEFCDVG